MNRLALILAAAFAGTGCIVTAEPTPPPPCTPSAFVDWSYQGGSSGGFVDATNTLRTTCAAAGVSTVEVYVGGTQVAALACSSAPALVPLAPGANDVIVEGLDAPSSSGGTILYRDRLAIDATTCGSQGSLVAQPAEGFVTVSYQLPSNQCVSPGPSFIWVRVRDDIAGVIAADSASAPETTNTCGVNFPLQFRLAAGSYTLLSTEEVVRTNPAVFGNYTPVGRNCTPGAFPVSAGTTTNVIPALVDATTFCP
jgi:hypothetical protein